MNTQAIEGLKKFIAGGPQVRGSNLHGYTKGQLTKMGIEKSALKKAVRAGAIRQISVNQSGVGGAQAFFCVEVEPMKVEVSSQEPAPEALMAPPAELGVSTEVPMETKL